MHRTVTAGLDGSPESRAAAEWAAREAGLRGLALRIVHVREPLPDRLGQAPLPAGETWQDRAERIPREAAKALRLRHPGLEVVTGRLTGTPAEALIEAAGSAEMLVLGSRGFGGIGGVVVGSVSLAVIARAERPVVLVPSGEDAVDEHRTDPSGAPGASSATTPFRPVVLGLDSGAPDETLLEFAFDAAVRRGAPLRVVYGWSESPAPLHRSYRDAELYDSLARTQAGALAEVLCPWRQKFPDVDVTEVSRCGSAAQVLVDASHEASLVVVGRRTRTSPLGTHVGHVAHAVLHHAPAPVAVVPHD